MTNDNQWQNRPAIGPAPVERSVKNGGNDLDAILEQAVVPRPEMEGQGVATPKEINVVIVDIMLTTKIPMNQENFHRVYVSVYHMVQIGATSPKFAETRKITDYGLKI